MHLGLKKIGGGSLHKLRQHLRHGRPLGTAGLESAWYIRHILAGIRSECIHAWRRRTSAIRLELHVYVLGGGRSEKVAVVLDLGFSATCAKSDGCAIIQCKCDHMS